MSFDLRDIREVSNEPQSKFINQLAKKLGKFLVKQQTDKLENKEDIYSAGQDTDSIIKFHSLVSTKSFDFLTQYETPLEPDYDKVRLWIKGNNMGNELDDISGFDRTVSLLGDVIIVDGTPFDYGIHTGGTKSIALRFNRPTSENENEEYVRIAHSSDISVSGISTGISYFLRFKIHALDDESGEDRTLLVKYDDASNGVLVQVTSTGRLVFILERAGTEYRVQTATSTIATDTVYEVWCTYANSGNVQHIYVNNVDKSLTAPSAPTWPTATTDMLVMTRSTDDGHVYGDLYDFTLYREQVVSATEVGRHYTNKWSISDIAFGKVAVANYYAMYETASATSFTSTSFTSTSFTT